MYFFAIWLSTSIVGNVGLWIILAVSNAQLTLNLGCYIKVQRTACLASSLAVVYALIRRRCTLSFNCALLKLSCGNWWTIRTMA